MARQRGIFLTEKIEKELEREFLSNRLKIDRLNRAYYGMTFDELIKLTAQNKEGDENAAGARRLPQQH